MRATSRAEPGFCRLGANPGYSKHDNRLSENNMLTPDLISINLLASQDSAIGISERSSPKPSPTRYSRSRFSVDLKSREMANQVTRHQPAGNKSALQGLLWP